VLTAFSYYSAAYGMMSAAVFTGANKEVLSVIALLMSAIYFGYGYFQKESQGSGILVMDLHGLSSMFLAISIAVQFEQYWITIGWAVESLALIWLGLSQKDPRQKFSACCFSSLRSDGSCSLIPGLMSGLFCSAQQEECVIAALLCLPLPRLSCIQRIRKQRVKPFLNLFLRLFYSGVDSEIFNFFSMTLTRLLNRSTSSGIITGLLPFQLSGRFIPRYPVRGLHAEQQVSQGFSYLSCFYFRPCDVLGFVGSSSCAVRRLS